MSDLIQFSAFGSDTTTSAKTEGPYECKQQLKFDSVGKAQRSATAAGQLQQLEAVPGEDLVKLTITNPQNAELVL